MLICAGLVHSKMADCELSLTSKPGSQQASSSQPEDCGEEGTEPRLMISKIVCENFKSYAGTKELGPFHKVIIIALRHRDKFHAHLHGSQYN